MVSYAVASDSGHLSIAGTFSVGDRVVITGIAKNTHLNNLQGEVVLIDEQDGKPRFRVDLGDEMGERAFFPKNLRRAPELVVTVPDEKKQKRPPNTLVTLRARYAIFGHGILLDYVWLPVMTIGNFPLAAASGEKRLPLSSVAWQSVSTLLVAWLILHANAFRVKALPRLCLKKLS